MTYASDLDASVVVWIVSNAREKHASAIELLNNHTMSALVGVKYKELRKLSEECNREGTV